MATKTKRKSKEQIEAEQRAQQAELRTEQIIRDVKIFVTGVDELFKGRPNNQEVGSTLAMMIESLEQAVNDRG